MEWKSLSSPFNFSSRFDGGTVFKATRCVDRFQLALRRTRYTLKPARELISEQRLGVQDMTLDCLSPATGPFSAPEALLQRPRHSRR